ncbi:CARDB domain-containing protein [Delftia tsuruhatensis]|uniref:CARDB domain-containing protein n=1 Tax=Delftia tsuruhatensis TaxID=180282 RepID=UPI0028A5B008|nr:CARDB domain-containing protein [Delftia tsuruhatensis]
MDGRVAMMRAAVRGFLIDLCKTRIHRAGMGAARTSMAHGRHSLTALKSASPYWPVCMWLMGLVCNVVALLALMSLPDFVQSAAASSQLHPASSGVRRASGDAPGLARFIRDEKGVSIIEFSGEYGIDLVAPSETVGKEFFRTHADVYDFLVVFSSFEYPTASADGENALAFHRGVRNDTAGIGIKQFDNSHAYGSKGVLQSYIDMAAASRWASATSSADYESMLSTFAHELQHRWGSHVKFRDWNGQISSALVGKDGSHWSYLLDSQGSVLYGASWRDNGEGSFTAIDTQSRYSPLDLYLAGLIGKDKVPPFFLIEAPDVDGNALPAPLGTTIRGTKRIVTIDDVIAAEGPRIPSADVSQKTFRFGFIYLVRPGETIDPADLDVVAQARRQVGLRYNALTHGLGVANVFAEPPQTTSPGVPGTTLPLDVPGPANPGNSAAGLSWLKAQQRSDGSFMDAAGLAPRDTLLARSFLRASDPVYRGLGPAGAWIAARPPGNTDFLARRLIESTAGERRAEDVSALLATRNHDGGWGLGERLRSNPLDTALAVQALRLVNADESVLRPAVQLLVSWQNPDGGWGNAATSPSRVHASAQVLKALAGLTSAQAPIASVQPFLKSRQNTDGGFGDGASSIHDTAHASMAMAAAGFDSEISLPAAQRFVAESQRMDGSWQGSVYNTVLALQMLRSAASANLAIGNLQASSLPIFDGQRVTLSARVVNAGSLQSEASTVRFFDGDPAAGGIAIGSPIPIAALVGGDGTTVQATWNTTSRAGSRTVFAVVDFEQATADLSRQDNVTSLSLVVESANPLADLLLGDGDVLATPSTVKNLPATLQIDALVSNAGMAAVKQAKAVLWSGTGADRVRLAETAFDLAARATTALQFKPTLSEPGVTVYTVELDPDGFVKEATRANNSSSVTVRTAGGVSLAVSKADISLNPDAPRPGADVMFTARLRNSGTQDSSSFNVRYGIQSGAGTAVLLTNVVQIAAGSTVEQQIPWRAGPGGDYSFIVEMDPEKASGDGDTSDNAAALAFKVAAKAGLNLAVSYRDLAFSPSPALEGSVMTLSALVRNVGDVDATAFDVEFFDGDPAAGGISLGATRVASLAAGSSTTATVNWEVPNASERLIFAVVDPKRSQPEEITLDDNVAFASLRVLTLPDFAVSQGALSLAPPLPKPGEAATLAVTVANLGDQGARNLVVSAFNGSPAAGIRLAPDVTVPVLAGKAGATVHFSFDAPAGAGLSSITVVVNPDAAIKERVKDNNTATISLATQAGDYAVSEAFISPNGDGVKDSTVLSYRLPAAMAVTIQVSDDQFQLVRTGRPAGSGASGSWSWDGLDDEGRLVPDGRYELAVRNADGLVLGGATVEIDTNRSSLLSVMGTPLGINAGLTCSLPRNVPVESIREGSGFYLNVPTAQDVAIDLPAGIYRQDDWGRGMHLVLGGLSLPGDVSGAPSGWRSFVADEQGTRLVAYNSDLEHLVVSGGEGEGRKLISTQALRSLIGLSHDGSEVFVHLGDGNLGAIHIGTGAVRALGAESVYDVRLSPDRTRLLAEASAIGTLLVNLVNGHVRALPNDHRYYWSPDGRLVVGQTPTELLVLNADGNELRQVSLENVVGQEAWSEDSAELYLPVAPDCTVSEDGASRRCAITIRRIEIVSGRVTDIPPFFETFDMANGRPGSPIVHLVAVPGRHEVLASVSMGGDIGASRSAVPVTASGAVVRAQSGQDAPRYRLIYLRSPHAVSSLAFGEAPPFVQPGYEGLDRSGVSRFIEYGRGIQYEAWDNPGQLSSCVPFGDRQPRDTYVFRTLANLQTDLALSRRADGVSVKVHGGVADRNFARYWLDYASDDAPETWHPIAPPSSTPLWDKDLAMWVSPGVGRYTVRLMAEDRAGNRRQKLRRVAIAQAGPPITNVVREPSHISPNGDGTKDVMSLTYRVLEPVNLEFSVFNRQGGLVRTFSRNHPAGNVDASIVWDGRDDNGQIVVDGEYRIHVVGFDFFVHLDNSAPVINELKNETPFSDCLGSICRRTQLSWDVSDAHFDSVQLEVSDGSNPGRWSPYGLRADESKRQRHVNLLSLADYAGKRYRLTVVDLAGNRTVAQFAPAQQELRLILAGQILERDLEEEEVPAPPNHHGKMFEGREVALRPASGIALIFAETLDDPVVSVSLQFNEEQLAEKGEWLEQPHLQVYPIGDGQDVLVETRDLANQVHPIWMPERSSLEGDAPIPQNYGLVGFYNSSIAADKGVSMRLKLTGKSGTQYFTNEIVTRSGNKLSINATGLGETMLGGVVDLTTSRVAKKLEVFVSSPTDAYHAIERRILLQQLNSIVPPDTTFGFQQSGRYVSCAGYRVRALVTFDNGSTMQAEDSIQDCGGVDFQIRPNFAASCEADAPHQLHGVVRPIPAELVTTPLLSLEVFADVPTGGRQLVFNVVNPRYQDYEFTFDHRGLPEGEGVFTGITTDRDGVKRHGSFKAPVDHSPPAWRITYPQENQRVCAVPELHKAGRDREDKIVNALRPEVEIEDAAGFDYLQEFRLGDDEYAPWQPVNGALPSIHGPDPRDETGASASTPYVSNEFATSPKILSRPYMSAKRLAGPLGPIVNISGQVTSRITVFDWSGAQSCRQVRFYLDGTLEAGPASVDRRLFSPGTASTLDSVILTIQPLEPMAVTVVVRRVVQGKLVPVESGGLVRQLTNRLSVSAGTRDLVWDGRNDAGQYVEDGYYTFDVTYEDGCGNLKAPDPDNELNLLRSRLQVEVDRTAPALLLDKPLAGEVTQSFLDIVGSATDKNLLQWILDYSQGDAWTALASQTSGVDLRKLAALDASSLEGVVTLRLRAFDRAELSSELTRDLKLKAPVALLRKFSVTPDTFSPNGDGRLDSVRVTYDVLQPAFVDLTIRRGALVVRRLVSQSLASPGETVVTWDGLNDALAPAPDAEYTVEIRATSRADQTNVQKEESAVLLDATPPLFTLDSVLGEFMPGNAGLVGSVSDRMLRDYQIFVEGPLPSTKRVLMAEGSEVLVKSALGSLQQLGLDDARYRLKVIASDEAENASSYQSAEFELDSKLPDVSFSSPAPGTFVSRVRPADVAGLVADHNLSSAQLMINGHAVQAVPVVSSPAALSLAFDGAALQDGRYSMQLVGTDKAGNVGQVTVSINVDQTPPVAQITAPVAHAAIGTMVPVVGTASDEHMDSWTVELGSGVGETLDALTVIGRGTANVVNGELARLVGLPPDGPATLRLTVLDKAGNASRFDVPLQIDATPPRPPVLSARREQRSDVRLDWLPNNDVERIVGYRIYRNGQKLNGRPWLGTEYLDVGLIDGDHAYTVTALSRSGVESAHSNVVQVRIKASGPLAHISKPATESAVGGLLSIEGSAYALTNFLAYQVSVGEGASPKEWKVLRTSALPVQGDVLANWPTAGLPEGAVYTIRLEAQDTEGGLSSAQVRVLVDNLPPTKPLGLRAQLSGTQDVSLDWTASTEPDLAGYLLYRNGQLVNQSDPGDNAIRPYLINATSYLDKALPDGTFVYTVVAADKADNLSGRSDPASVTVDNRPPKAVIVQPSNGAGVDGVTYVRAESPDLDIASVRFEYKAAADADWTLIGTASTKAPYSVNWDTKALTPGSYQLRAVATDLGGRTDPAPAAISVVRKNLQRPKPATDLIAQVDGGDVSLRWTASPSSGVQGYHVQRIDAAGDITRVTTAPVVATQLVDAGRPDGRHGYQVLAVDQEDNESDPSPEAKAWVYTTALKQPYTPLALAATPLRGHGPDAVHAVAVTSAPETGAPATLSLSPDAEGGFQADAVPLAMGANIITARQTYEAGNRSRAGQVRVARGDPPAAPEQLQAVASGGVLRATWSASSSADVTGYVVRVDGKPDPRPFDFVAAVASTEEGSYARAGRAIDGNDDTAWLPDEQDPAPWIELSAARKELVQELSIVWSTYMEPPTSYAVEAWDGFVWVPLKQDNANAEQSLRLALDPPYFTERIRISLGAAADGVAAGRVGEVRGRSLAVLGGTEADIAVPGGRHTVSVQALSQLGLLGTAASASPAGIGDITPPPPVQTRVEVDGTMATVSWTESAADDLASYEVLRDGVVIATVAVTKPRLHVDGPLANGSYAYTVRPVDVAGNAGELSNEAVAQIASVRPGAPLQLALVAPAAGSELRLSWQAPASADGTASYVLYRATAVGGPYSAIAMTDARTLAYSDQEVVNGVRYYYVVRSRDAAGNEGDASNEVDGVALDRMGPSAPLIFHPTDSAHPLVVSQPSTAVRVFSEPSARVQLSRDGVAVASANALAGLRKTRVFDRQQAMTLASRADLVATISFDGLSILHVPPLLDGSAAPATLRKVSGAGIGGIPVWSPDASQLLLQSGGGSVRLVRVADGSVSEPELDGFVQMLDWHPDGKRWLGVTNGGEALVEVPVDGAASRTVARATRWFSNFAIAPDGQHVAAVDGGQLVLLSLPDGHVLAQSQPGADDYEPLQWSSDGQSVYFLAKQGDAQAYQVHLQHVGQAAPVVATAHEEGVDHFSLSPTDALAFVRGTQLHIVDAAGAAPRSIDMGIHPESMAWARSGLLFVTDSDGVTSLALPGTALFPPIALRAGRNLLVAQATDLEGNAGAQSAAISVTYDAQAAALPDFSVRGADVTVLPQIPRAGEASRVTVVVNNVGIADAPDARVRMLATSPGGTRVELLSTRTTAMTAGGSQVLRADAVFDTAGDWQLSIAVDADDEVQEVSEDNNVLVLPVRVVGATAVRTLVAGVANPAYPVGAMLSGSVTLFNGGADISGQLRLRIEDAQGDAVATLPSQSQPLLPYGQSRSVDFNWSVPAIFDGPYKVRASWVDGSVVLAQATASFLVKPHVQIDARVRSDSTSYAPGTVARIVAQVDPAGSSPTLGKAQSFVRVLDPAGKAVLEATDEVGLVAVTQMARTMDTAGLAQGAYTADLWVVFEGREVARSSTTFDIVADTNPVASLTGDIVLDRSSLPYTGSIAGTAILTNSGQTDLSDLQYEVVVLEPRSNTVLARSSHGIASLARGEETRSAFSFSAQGMPIGALWIQLRTSLASPPGAGRMSIASAPQPNLLRQREVAVFELDPPTVVIRQPVQGVHLRAAQSVQVAATDLLSGVRTVEFQVDGGGWQATTLSDPVSSSYVGVLPSLADGAHQLAARATDHSGNVSQPVQRSFVLDSQPPVIAISGVAENAYANPVTPSIVVTDPNLSVSQIRLDGSPFASGTPISETGSHVLQVDAIDLAGNTASRTVRFSIQSTAGDITAPVIDIRTPAAGAYLRRATSGLTATIVDAESAVAEAQFSIDSGAFAPLAMDATQNDASLYAASLDTLADGAHSVVVRARDTQGNEAITDARSFTVDNTPPVITISGVAAGQYVAAVTPVISVTDLALLGSSITLNGAAYVSATPVTASGDYVLNVDAVDKAGNSAASTLQFSIRLPVADTTPPAVFIEQPVEGEHVRRAAVLSVAATDTGSGVSSVDHSLDGQPQWSSLALSATTGRYMLDVGGLPDGAHAVSVRAADNAGNVSDVQLRRFIVDNTAPQVVITGVAEDGVYAGSASASIALSDTHLASSSIMLNGQPYVSGQSIATPGTYVLTAAARDIAGNETVVAVRFRVTAGSSGTPVVTITAPEANAVVRSGVPVLARVVPAENISRLEMAVAAGASYTAMASRGSGAHEAILAQLADGPVLLRVRAVDSQGVSHPDVVRTVTVDNTPPAIEQLSVADGGRYPAGQAISFKVIDAHLESVASTLDGQPFSQGQRVGSPGSHVLQITARDRAGNQAQRTVIFTVLGTAVQEPVAVPAWPSDRAMLVLMCLAMAFVAHRALVKTRKK